MLWNELEGAQQKIKDLQDEVNVRALLLLCQFIIRLIFYF